MTELQKIIVELKEDLSIARRKQAEAAEAVRTQTAVIDMLCIQLGRLEIAQKLESKPKSKP